MVPRFSLFMIGLHGRAHWLLVPPADAAQKPGNRENRDPGSPRNRPSQRNPQHVALTTASSQCGPHNAILTTRPSQRGPHNATLTTRPSQRGPHNAGLATRPSQRGPHNAGLATRPSQRGNHSLVLLEHYSDEYHGFRGFTVFMVCARLARLGPPASCAAC